MTTPYVGEIRMFGASFAPYQWALCNGQLLPISAYPALFALLGTAYGGDGITTFGLPDLRSRVPVGQGAAPNQPAYAMGQTAGSETVTLTTATMPAHNHMFVSTAAPT